MKAKAIVNLSTTIVFDQIRAAVNAVNPDGSRKYKYIVLRGSSRSSKTYSLIDLFDMQARTVSGQRLTVWRDTKTDCKKTVLADMLRHHQKTGRYTLGYKFNRTESIFHYNHVNGEGSTVEIHGTDDEESVHGLTQNWAWLNEPYKMSQDTFDQIDMRAELVFLDYNPKKDTFIDDIIKLPTAIVIDSTFKDNPFCPAASRAKILGYQPIQLTHAAMSGIIADTDTLRVFDDEEELRTHMVTTYAAKLQNKHINEVVRCWRNEKRHTASEYKWKVYGLGEKAESPNKIHQGWYRIDHIEYIQMKKFSQMPVYYGLDFGFANPSACVEVIYDGDMTFYVQEIMYKPIRKMKNSLGETLISHGVRQGNTTMIFADSADRDPSTNRSMINDLRAYHSLNALPVRKPGYKERFEFMSKCIIKYTRESRNLEKEYENYEWEYINGVATERPVKVDDHLMNALEYCMWEIKLRHKLSL